MCRKTPPRCPRLGGRNRLQSGNRLCRRDLDSCRSSRHWFRPREFAVACSVTFYDILKAHSTTFEKYIPWHSKSRFHNKNPVYCMWRCGYYRGIGRTGLLVCPPSNEAPSCPTLLRRLRAPLWREAMLWHRRQHCTVIGRQNMGKMKWTVGLVLRFERLVCFLRGSLSPGKAVNVTVSCQWRFSPAFEGSPMPIYIGTRMQLRARLN